MCERFTVIETFENLAAHYKARPFDGSRWKENYNIAAKQESPVITKEEDGLEIRPMIWGLVPFWAKDSKIGTKMINAEAGTVQEKPGFRDSFKDKRCIIPASGFYAWMRFTEHPYYFSPPDGLFSFAGLWSRWIAPDTKEVETFTIITTTANKTLKAVCDRMPVILGKESFRTWLDASTKAKDLQALLVPVSHEAVSTRLVSKYVNKIKNNDPKCIARMSE